MEKERTQQILNDRRAELRLWSDKLAKLRETRAIETDTNTIFKLDAQVKELEITIKDLEKVIDPLETKVGLEDCIKQREELRDEVNELKKFIGDPDPPPETRLLIEDDTYSLFLPYKRDPRTKLPKPIPKLIQKPNERALLNWRTFGYGLNILGHMIRDVSQLSPDIVLGINNTGVMMAGYLSFFFAGVPPHVGVIYTGQKRSDGTRVIDQFDCPQGIATQFDGTTDEISKVKKPKSIALLDAEMKSGLQSKHIIDKLMQLYGDKVEIINIVMCGVIKENDRGKKPDDMMYFGWDIADAKYKPDLMAFYCDPPGMKAPGGLP